MLTDVRVGRHDGFDRVVLELAGDDAPDYRVSYVDPPIVQDGNGRPVDVAGGAFLELGVVPSGTADLSGEQPREVYAGPSRREPAGAGIVTEVVKTADFEANLAWVVGLERRAPFAVALFDNPLRLVVDVVTGT